MRVLRGVVYMMKSRGPRMEPWGTPQEEVHKDEKVLFITPDTEGARWQVGQTSWGQSHGYRTKRRDEWVRCCGRWCQRQTKPIHKLDSMRWFFHQRSPSPPAAPMVSSVAVCCVRPSYGARPTMHCPLGWVSSFFSVGYMGWYLVQLSASSRYVWLHYH